MKAKSTLVVLILFVCGFSSTAQIYAVQNGIWDNSTTSGNNIWSTIKGAVSGTPGLRPTSSDDVYTNGRNISVSAGTCKNLFVSHTTSNALSISNGRTLTITGTLTGWDDVNGLEELPMPDAITYVGTTSNLSFTGANLGTYDPYVIFFWDSSTPLGRTNFNFGTGTYSTLFDVAFSGTLRVVSGTFSLDPSAFISGTGVNSAIQVDAGATLQANSNSISNFPAITITGSLRTSGTISATNLTLTGSLTSSSSITLSGDLTLNSGGTVNTSGTISCVNASIGGTLTTSNAFTTSGTLTLSSGGNLSTSYSGTQGWWLNTSSPATLNVDAASTVTLSANTAQNLYAQSYGNLTLSGSGLKTVTGSGALIVKGNLSVGSPFNSDASSGIQIGGTLMNNAAWSPSDQVTFNGTATQQIGGPVQPIFAGGLEVNKASGTFSLLRSISISNGLTITQGTFNASNYTITLSGNLANNGTLSFGSGSSLGTMVIDGSTAVSGTIPSFGHLTINSTRSFTSTGTINVAGNITNNGTFNVTGVAFNGTTPQSVNGTLSLTNLTVRDGADVSNLGTINMSTSGVVTLEGTALFDAGSGGTNTLRLQSTTLSNGARIATLPNPDRFSGNVTVERYINSPEDWRYLAIPVLNANVGMLKDDFPVTGNFSDPSPVGGNVVSSTSPSIFYINSGWQSVGSGGSVASTSLSNTTGYAVWSYLSAGVSLDVDGEIGKGPKGITIRSGDNLIPNPYPSAIDWDNVDFTNANLQTNTVYVRTASGQYASYAGGVATGNHPLGSGWGGQLATGQSFWVVASGAGTLTFQEDDKTSSTNFVRETEPSDYIRIRLKKDTLSDDVIVRFKENATLGRDVAFDALKKPNDLRLNISTYNDDPASDFAINAVPLVGCEFTTHIKLATNNPVGNYSIAFEDLSSLTTGYEMTLVDNFLQKTEQITDDKVYSFSITSDPASTGAGRFKVIFKVPGIDEVRQFAMDREVNCAEQTTSITIANSQSGVDYYFQLDGARLHEPIRGTGASVTMAINTQSLAPGTHALNLVAETNNGCQTFEYKNAFSLQVDDIPSVKTVSSTTACFEGITTLTVSGAPPNGSYNWYETETSAVPIEGIHSAEFTTPVINKSRTYFVTAVNASGCESSVRLPMQAVVYSPEVPVISVQADMLKVDEGLGTYQWLRDGETIDGANSNTYQVEQSGVYSVTTSSNNCTVESNGFEFIVNGSEHSALADHYDLFPNPITETLTLKGPHLDRSEINIFDRAGKEMKVQHRVEKGVDGEWLFSADVSHFRNGLYVLSIKNGSQLVQLKVVKR